MCMGLTQVAAGSQLNVNCYLNSRVVLGADMLRRLREILLVSYSGGGGCCVGDDMEKSS